MAKFDWLWVGLVWGIVACAADGTPIDNENYGVDPASGGADPFTPGTGSVTYMSGGLPSTVPNGGAPGTGGVPMDPMGGMPPMGGTPSTGGMDPMGGIGGMTGMTGGAGGMEPGGTGGMEPGGTGGMEPGGTGGMEPGGTGGMQGTGTCCPDGNCLCHGPDPSGLTSRSGPFRTADFRISTGTVHYPTDAEPPFAAVAVCGGLTNTGPEMAAWAPFYASHGIVGMIVTTGALDDPATRGRKLVAAIQELKTQNTNSSPLAGKLAGRYGTSGYSMGGGGTTLATISDSTLMTSVGLAAWGPNGNGVQVPTLFLCGDADIVAPCLMSQGAYGSVPNTTPKMMITIAGATHFAWFGPTGAGSGTSGEAALAFQKVYLEGDQRWKPFLLQSRGTKVTNIQ